VSRMTRSLLAALAIVVTLVSVSALAGRPVRPGGIDPDVTPSVIAPLPYDHEVHAEVMEAKGVTCVTCHPVGARKAAGGAPDEPIGPPLHVCHGCHLREVKGAPRKAQPKCIQCHDDRSELIPVNHRVGWMEMHGIEARALSNGCDSCHEPRRCVDCHENRGALSRTPHPPGFRATHGIEARIDPASCSTCHVETTCTECHTSGVIPW